MSLQQFKAKLLAVSLFTVSACGTFAIFGSVPVIAKIVAAPPFSLGKIEAFLLQQTDRSPVPTQTLPARFSSNRSSEDGKQSSTAGHTTDAAAVQESVH